MGVAAMLVVDVDGASAGGGSFRARNQLKLRQAGSDMLRMRMSMFMRVCMSVPSPGGPHQIEAHGTDHQV